MAKIKVFRNDNETLEVDERYLSVYTEQGWKTAPPAPLAEPDVPKTPPAPLAEPDVPKTPPAPLAKPAGNPKPDQKPAADTGEGLKESTNQS